MKVHVKTLGCRLNQAESERIAQGFALVGHEVTPDPALADLIVLNSCTVTARAARDSVRAARHRAGQRLIVTGCHSEIAPDDFGDADLLVASADKENLVALAAAAPGMEGVALGADYRPDGAPMLYPLLLDSTRAFVKVQDGCNLSCAFCLTTLARGAARSRPVEQILAEIASLVARGCQEVVLTGVHAGAYGQEQPDHPDLGMLIERILSESALPRLRLSSLEPWNFRAAWLPLWARWGERLCRHLHMSLQSGSDSVLRRMRRAYRAADFAAKVEQAREAIPGVAITTDLIVGFPGERDEEHAESLRVVRDLAFAGAHLFPFSARPGTRAATMEGQLPERLKHERLAELRAVTDGTAAAYRAAQLGTVQRVLWEKPMGDGSAQGLTDRYLRVTSRDPRARRNQLAWVRLVALDGERFTGELAEGMDQEEAPGAVAEPGRG